MLKALNFLQDTHTTWTGHHFRQKLSDQKFPMDTNDAVAWLYGLARLAIDKAHSQQCRPY